MHLRGAVIIAGDEAVEDLGQKAPFLRTEPAHDAEIDRHQLAVVVDEQVAGMHVGVEEAVAQRVAQEGLDDRAAELLEHEALGGELGAVVQRRRLDPFERQHVARGQVPVHCRHAEFQILAGVLRHLRERRRFQPQVHLDRDRTAQRLDHLDQPQPLRLDGELLGLVGDEAERLDIERGSGARCPAAAP